MAYLDEVTSAMALRRVWGAERLSWWLTNLMHRFPDDTAFDEKDQGRTSSIHLADLHGSRSGLPWRSKYVGPRPFES